MAFDETLLAPAESKTGFDESLLTPVDGANPPLLPPVKASSPSPLVSPVISKSSLDNIAQQDELARQYTEGMKDASFTAATGGGLPGLVSKGLGALSEKVIEPAAAATINRLSNPLGLKGADSVEAGKSVIPDQWLPLANEKGFVPALTRTLQELTTPGSIVTLPIALESKPIQQMFLAATASSAPELVGRLTNAKDSNEVKDAATELGINTLFAAALSKGLKSGELKPEPIGEKNATNPQQQQEGGRSEHQGATQEPLPAEAGSGNRPVGTAEGAAQTNEAPSQVPTPAPRQSSETLKPSEVVKLPPKDFADYVNAKPGALTGEAWRIGQNVKSKAEADELQALSKDSAARFAEAKSKKDLDLMMSEAMKGQFFREAYEAATGAGSAGEALSAKDPNYKPPFPIEAKPSNPDLTAVQPLPVKQPEAVEPRVIAGGVENNPATPAAAVELEPTKPIKQQSEKEPWQMTKEEAIKIGEDVSKSKKSRNIAASKAFQDRTDPNFKLAQKNFNKAREVAIQKLGIKGQNYNQGRGLDSQQLAERLTPEQSVAYHKLIVKKAILEGKPVPPEVLKDYPDLQPKPVLVSEPAVESITPLEPQSGNPIVAAPEKVRVGKNPQPHTVLERLPQSAVEKENGEQALRVRNDKTGEESVVASTDITPISMREGPKPPSAKKSLDDKLMALGWKKNEIQILSKSEKKAIADRGESKITGSVGAALADSDEFGNGTSLKNAAGELDRVAHGFPESYPTTRREMAQTWLKAGDIVANDPAAGAKLADELKYNPERGLTDEESALLLRHKVALENAKNQAASDTITAKTNAERAEAENRFNGLSAQLLELLDAAKFRGSQWGREGRWRQAIAFDDFSLETMIRDKEEAIGRKLTPAESEQIKKLNETIADLQRQLEAKQKEQTAKTRKQVTGEKTAEAVKKAREDSADSAKKGVERDWSEEFDDTVKSLKERFEEQGDLVDGNMAIQKLMELLARDGIHERDEMESIVHAVLKDEVNPDITLEETQDLMSGYGKFKRLSKDPIKVIVRGIKGEVQQVRKLLDFFQGQGAKKTGVERRLPTDQERAWIKVVNEAKKAFHILPTDPAAQLKSALDAVNTRLKNRLADLKQEVATRQKIVRERTSSPYNDETLRLKKEIEEIQKQHDEIFGRAGLTEAQRLRLAENNAARQIEELERQLKTGEIFSRNKVPSALTSEKLEALRARIEALKSEREWARESIQPKMEPEQRQLLQILQRYNNLAARYEDRLAAGDFEAKPRRTPPENEATNEAKARVERAKLNWRRALEQDKHAKRTNFQKVSDVISSWKRMAVLTWPTTFAKLTAAAAEGLIVSPIENLGFAAVRKVLPRSLTEKSQRYGSAYNPRAAVAGYAGTISNLVKNFGQAAKTGNIELDLNYGKPNVVPADMSGWIGNLHYAFKTPLMQHEWSSSFRILMDEAARRGVDTTNPAVIQQLGNKAYVFAEERLFLEDNLAVNMYNSMLQRARQVDKETGKQTATGKIAETALRFELPIVRIPTNIVKRAFEYAFGTATGSARLARALIKGIDTLPEKEADAIIRNLTRGSIGTAFLLYGFFNPQQFGGYYQEGRKPEPGQPKYGSWQIGGVNIPTLILHHPLLEQFQIGATMRRVADSHLRKKDTEPQGLSAGAWAALMGLTDEAPFVGEIKDAFRSLKEPADFAGEALKSAIPGLVQWVAKQSDQPDLTTKKFLLGTPTSRKPSTVVQHVETGLPVLREQVPERAATR